MLAKAMIALLERLWPVWLLLLILAGWRLWFLRARGEGDPHSRAAERRRWKIGLLATGALFALSFALAMLGGRPHEGPYEPVQMETDGSLAPARPRKDAP